MRILALTNLYPPHLAGGVDTRCAEVVEQLKQRGHETLVLTSHFGLKVEQRDPQVERRLILNGFAGQPPVTGYGDLRDLELRNNEILQETLRDFGPEIVLVFSLR